MLSVLLSALAMSSGDLTFRISFLNHKCLNSRLHSQRGAPKIRCIVSSCDFTSVMDCKLNQRSIADPEPWFCSRAFSMHKEKLCSMTLTKEPCPDFVKYFVMYSMTASFDSVAWKSKFESMASIAMGTKLLRNLQFRANHNRNRSRLRGSSEISSWPGNRIFRGYNLLQHKRPCSRTAQLCSADGGPLANGSCKSCMFTHSASAATNVFLAHADFCSRVCVPSPSTGSALASLSVAGRAWPLRCSALASLSVAGRAWPLRCSFLPSGASGCSAGGMFVGPLVGTGSRPQLDKIPCNSDQHLSASSA